MAIFITTPRDIRLFYNSNYITVSRGFNRTINFLSDQPGVVNQPASLQINGITDINSSGYIATATLTSGTDSQQYFYEVVSPKVIYKRLPDTQGILLYDVTSVQTYPHPDVSVSNTSWLQNPILLNSTVIVEREVSPGVWETYASFKVTGTALVKPSAPVTLRSRIIYAPSGTIEWEAIGDTFILTPGGYQSSNIYYTVDSTEGVYYANNSIVTTFPDQSFILTLKNDGEGYTIEYHSSSITPVIGLYSSANKTLTISNLPEGYYTINFGYQYYSKIFFNGLLISTGGLQFMSSSVDIESVAVEISSYVQKSCSDIIEIVDSTNIFNPALANRGRVEYEIEISGEWYRMASIPRTNRFTYSNCALGPGQYNIRKRFIARQVVNCGGTSRIILLSSWVYNTITVLEYIPRLELTKPPCCVNLGETVTILPSIVEVNNDLCEQLTLTGGFNPQNFDPNHFATFSETNQSISYQAYRYDIDTSSWIPEEEYSTIIVSNNPNSAVFRFTPTQLSPYKVVAQLSNCCDTVEKTVEFDICECLQVRPVCKSIEKCSECDVYEIINNCTTPQTVNIKLSKTNQTIQTYTINPLSKQTHRFKEDNIYIITYGDKNVILPIFCKINECYNKLLKEQLCKTTTSGCCDDRELMNGRLATIQPIYQLFLNKLEYYNIRANYRYTAIDITNQLDDFAEWDKLKEALLKYCDVCRLNCPKCFNWSNGTCI
jgi:hypothetical protein